MDTKASNEGILQRDSTFKEKSNVEDMELKISFTDLYVYFEKAKKKKQRNAKIELFKNIRKYKKKMEKILSTDFDHEKLRSSTLNLKEVDIQESKNQSQAMDDTSFDFNRDVKDAFKIIEKLSGITDRGKYISKVRANTESKTNSPRTPNTPKSSKTFPGKSKRAK